MKKVLYGTTALIAAGLVGAGSAQAADPIKLGLGGYSYWYLSWQSQADSFKKFNSVTGAGGGQVDMTSFDVQGDTEVYFSGSTTLDNGLKVSVMSQLEAGGNQNTRSSSTDVIDEAFVTVEGGFGKLEIGTLNLATYRSQVSAPDYTGELQEAGLVSGRWVAYPGANQANEGVAGSVLFQGTTAMLTTSDAEKINYYTPSFGGATLMASYVPGGGEDARMVADNRQAGGGEAYSLGAAYSQTFSGVGVKAMAGWLTQDGSTMTRNREWNTGLQLSYAGFSVGGAYRKISQKFDDNTIRSASATLTDATGATWNAGIGYEQGPWGVSADYMQSHTNGLRLTAGKDKMKTYQVGGKYTLSPGVDLMALAGYIKFDDETTKATPGDGNHNDGWAVATAIKLRF